MTNARACSRIVVDRDGKPYKPEREKKMIEIEQGKVSAHFINDHKARLAFIEKTIGIGEPVYVTIDKKGRDCYNILTDTGAFVVQGFNGTIVTVWIANVKQASILYKRATGRKDFSTFNPSLYWRVQYNNNSKAWKEKVAA